MEENACCAYSWISIDMGDEELYSVQNTKSNPGIAAKDIVEFR